MKALLAATALSTLLALSAYADDAPAGKDYVILKVGSDEVKKSEVDSMLKGDLSDGDQAPKFETLDPRIKANILRVIASEHVLLDAAKKAGVDNTDEVKEHLREAQNQIIVEAFLRDKTQAATSDEALHAAYDSYVKAVGPGKEEVQARHILLKTKAEADAIEKKLKKGADFATLAKQESQDKGSGAAGGELGWFTAERMTPEFSKAAFALRKGETSAPVKTDFGWHIIQVEDRRKMEVPTFEQAKPELKREVSAKAVRTYVDSLMKDVKVTEVDADGHEQPLSAMAEPAATPAAAAPAAGQPAAAADKSDKPDADQ